MILSDKAAAARLASSGNLLNKLTDIKAKSRNNAMSLFIPAYKRDNNEREVFQQVPKAVNPFSAESKTELILKESEESKSFNPFEKPDPLPANNELAVRLNQTVQEAEQATAPVPLTIDDLISNSDEQIQLNLAHNKALEVLNLSLDSLKTKMPDVSAAKLPAAITAASKVVESIRKERIEAKKIIGKDAEVHFHFYTPQQRKVSEYETIDLAAPVVESSLY